MYRPRNPGRPARSAALALCSTLCAIACTAAVATASWQGGGSGSSNAKAVTLGGGSTPTATVSGRAVTLSWAATAAPAGGSVSGYVIKRYGADGQPQTVGAGCAGVVAATSCTESAVTPGTWTYTVTPKLGNWLGAESAAGAPVTVAAPSLTLTGSTTLTTLPGTVTGTLAGFTGGATVTFRLDAVGGTVLTGSTTPSPVSASGSADASVTIPADTANGAHTIYAVGSDGSVASATITVSAATCRTTRPTYTLLTGLEHQSVGGPLPALGVNSAIFNNAVNTTGASVDTAVKRSGAYSLKIEATGAAVRRGKVVSALGNALVVRFGLYLDALPAADSELAGFSDTTAAGPANLALKYVAATRKLAIGYPGQTVEGSPTIEAQRWYVIEMRYDPRANPRTADWRIDGVAQPSTSYAQTGAGSAVFALGTSIAGTYVAHYDDIVISETASEYPLGDGRIYGLLPDGMGTSVGTVNFANDDSTLIGPATWSRLDDPILATGTDYVKQTLISTTSYVELTFADSPHTCFDGVFGHVGYDFVDTNGTSHGATTIVDGATVRTVFSGTMTGSNNDRMFRTGRLIAPASATWDQIAINGLRGRIGYSNDATPNPRWHSLALEYDVPQ